MELKVVRQCRTCPWRKDSRVADIPGYDPVKHKNLESAIATPEEPLKATRFMACHQSPTSHELPCIGWVANQLENSNVWLRIWLRDCENLDQLVLDGEQVDKFDETFK